MWIDFTNNAAVCRHNHAVHLCGEKCTIQPDVMTNGEGCVCPLTSIMVRSQAMVHQAMFNKAGKCINNPSGYKSKPKGSVAAPAPRKRKLLRRQITKAIVVDILNGSSKHKARKIQIERSKKKIEKAMKGSKRENWELARKLVAREHIRNYISPSCEMNKHVELLTTAITCYARKHPQCISGTPEVVVATYLTLLSTGLISKGVQIVPKNEFVAKNIPLPSLMSQIPRVHCRSISVAIRKFKGYTMNKNGDAKQNTAFIC